MPTPMVTSVFTGKKPIGCQRMLDDPACGPTDNRGPLDIIYCAYANKRYTKTFVYERPIYTPVFNPKG